MKETAAAAAAYMFPNGSMRPKSSAHHGIKIVGRTDLGGIHMIYFDNAATYPPAAVTNAVQTAPAKAEANQEEAAAKMSMAAAERNTAAGSPRRMYFMRKARKCKRLP